jgi:elongation factor 2 kinase
VRYDYDPTTKEWQESETLCKVEREQFAEGAMRRCFRMKKLSQSMRSAFIKLDWRHCPNYVAKEYKDDEIATRRDVVGLYTS